VYPTTWKLDEIPIERFYGVPAAVIDISRKVFLPGGNVRPNYAMVKEDVLE
jgi:kynurenine formamidase